ncbi:MAG: endonuclease domain-containing protein [Deltaproteobacteria bacterium]|nr:MAG: endonuclease domain-containing protein [Deltaproteobacteria bacterium]
MQRIRTTERAQQLRKIMTPQERVLWQKLRYNQLGVRFRRQQPIDCYIADFCCFEKRLIIELDGSIHQDTDQMLYDKERDNYLRGNAFHILHFWNDEIEHNLPAVLEKINQALHEPSPISGEGNVAIESSEGWGLNL